MRAHTPQTSRRDNSADDASTERDDPKRKKSSRKSKKDRRGSKHGGESPDLVLGDRPSVGSPLSNGSGGLEGRKSYEDRYKTDPFYLGGGVAGVAGEAGVSTALALIEKSDSLDGGGGGKKSRKDKGKGKRGRGDAYAVDNVEVRGKALLLLLVVVVVVVCRNPREGRGGEERLRTPTLPSPPCPLLVDFLGFLGGSKAFVVSLADVDKGSCVRV